MLCGERFAGDVIGSSKAGTVSCVVDRKSAHAVDDIDQNHGSEGTQACAGNGMGFQCGSRLNAFIKEGLGSCHKDGTGALDCNGLQLLNAHDGSHAAAAGCTVFVVHDSCKEASLFGSRRDAGDAEVLPAFFIKGFRCIEDVFSPEVGGVSQFDLIIVDIEVDRFFGDIFEDNAVIAGIFQFRSEMSAGVGSADGAGERRFCHSVVAAGRGGCSSGERARHKDQIVVRA